MQRRNKVGGIIDRRFGEDNPNMSLEEKMIERYTREQQRSHKKSSMFDLEEDDEPAGALTHMGKPLFDSEDEAVKDDFAEEDLPSGDESDGSRAERRRLKRQRLAELAEEAEDDEGEQPERKKTKKEIYEEVIAKSKLYKYVCFNGLSIIDSILTSSRNDKQLRRRTMNSEPSLTRRCLSFKPSCSRGQNRRLKMRRTINPP
jgi:hypothetical protein